VLVITQSLLCCRRHHGLTPAFRRPSAQSLIWKDVSLSGNTGAWLCRADRTNLRGSWPRNWRAGISPTTGNPIYNAAHRSDGCGVRTTRFLLDPIHWAGGPGRVMADYDLVIASPALSGAGQRSNSRHRRWSLPLVRSATIGRPGWSVSTRMATIPASRSSIRSGQATILSKTDRYAILRQVKHELGARGRGTTISMRPPTARSIFPLTTCTPLPDEVSGPIGNLDALFAAWNGRPIYVAQVRGCQAVGSCPRWPLPPRRSHRPGAEKSTAVSGSTTKTLRDFRRPPRLKAKSPGE